MERRGVVTGYADLVIVLLCFFTYCNGQENVIRFNRGEIKEIIDAHNNLRRSIYNAANMRELAWNEGLAIASSEWGSNCEYVTRPDNQWGQNMNYFYGKDQHRSPSHLFRVSFNAWTNDTVMHYDYRKFHSCGKKNVCSYVQLIAADVQQVGCSIVKCDTLKFSGPKGNQKQAKILVCFYSPWIDILNSEVFIPERRCGACPSGTRCVDNLCSARIASFSNIRRVPSIGTPTVDISITSSSSASHNKGGKGHHPVDNEIPTTSTGKKRDRKRKRKDRKRKHKSRKHAKGGIEETNGSGQGTVPGPQVHTQAGNETHVVYKTNNRVMPFPGRAERRDMRRIGKAEKYLEDHDKKPKQDEFVQAPAILIPSTNATGTAKSRKKRQSQYADAVYIRRLEYERYLREYRRHQRQREEARRQYEGEMRRRHSHSYRMQELRRQTERERYEEERKRRLRLREQRRRLEALALIQSQGELTGEEQFFTVSAHNMLRREVSARELSWSTYLERWAKYVIRCDTEYPGPISCYTNFGKSNAEDDVYSVVYQWGNEGYDMNRPLNYGCRTPYDKRLCNHNTIIRDKSLTQMACAAKNCGFQRQLTCIYNTS